MTTPAIYCVQREDENGIMVIDRFMRDESVNLDPRDEVAEYAERFPDVIYFEVAGQPTFAQVETALYDNVDKVIHEIVSIFVMLGSNAEWSTEHNFCTTEAIAELATRVGLPSAGDQNDADLIFWRSLADKMGINHDGEDS